MAIVKTDDQHYKAIADTIREKFGGNSKYTPADMAKGVRTACDYQYALGCSDGELAGMAAGIEQGKQAAWNEFWDSFQLNGNRVEYRSSFGAGWDDTTFAPKYDMPITYAEYMFAYSSITDLAAILKKQGVTLDFSKCSINGAMQMLVRESAITTFPVMNISKQGNCNYILYRARNLRSIEKVILSPTGNNGNLHTAFEECNALTDVVFEGLFAVSNLKFQWSPLSVVSMKSIISCLKDFTGTGKEYSYTLTFSDDCWAALEADSTAPDGGTWKDYVSLTLCWNV